MAIDTKAKRMSMLSFASPLPWHYEVDGAVDADDRAVVLHLYGGIAFDTPAAEDPVSLLENTAYEVYIENRNGHWERTRIVFTGTDFGVVR